MSRNFAEDSPVENNGPRVWSPFIAYFIILALALVLRISVSASRWIGFDEAWDIFVSRQDSLVEFFRAVSSTSHPPLVYGLLFLSSQLGFPQIVDPLVGIVCGLLAVVYVGRTLNLLGASRSAELAAMCLCAFSHNFILISVMVRPYMPAVACMLACFYYFLSFWRSRFTDTRARTCGVLLLFAAILCHYSGLLFACALVLSAIAGLLCFPSMRRALLEANNSPKRLWRNLRLMTFCALALTAYLTVSSQGSLFASSSLLATKDPLQITPYRYLAEFIYSPGQNLFKFVQFVWQAELNLLLPLRITSAPLSLIVLSILLIWLIFGLIKSFRQSPSGEIFLALALPLLLCLVPFSLSLIGKYPFGGELRQQFFIFPFLLIALLFLADALISNKKKALAEYIWGCVILSALVTSLSAKIDDSEPGKLPRLKKLSAQLDPKVPLYMGAWSAFTFYGQHRDWKLRFTEREADLLTYKLLRDGQELTLYVGPQVYFSDFSANSFPAKVQNLLDRKNLQELLIFGFPLGRMKCRICSPSEMALQLKQALGEDQFTTTVVKERTKNGEGFAIISRHSASSLR